jgi:hypothetical protein
MAETLKYLGLDPRRPEVQALWLLCRRYRLDLIAHHAELIKTSGGWQPYVTRDGMLEVAHRSGVFDGMVTEDEHEGETGWSATVSVFRRDMSHPFTYRGGCGKHEPAARQGHGPEMALARAERRALRRAFNLPTYDGADEPDDAEVDLPAGIVPAGRYPPPPPDGEVPAVTGGDRPGRRVDRTSDRIPPGVHDDAPEARGLR